MPGLNQTTLFNDANLTHYWKLEDTSDSKGALTLTNNNTVPFNPARFAKGADGGTSNTNKSLTNTTAALSLAEIQAPWSVSLWVKTNITWITTNREVFFSTVNDAVKGVDLDIYFIAGTGWRASVNDGTFTPCTSSVTPVSGQWTFLVFTYRVGTLSFYINAKAPVTASKTIGTGGIGVGGNGVVILGGANVATPSVLVEGIEDDVAVFTRELSATEVSYLYQAGDNFLPLIGVGE